jgi:hypothetical protein
MNVRTRGSVHDLVQHIPGGNEENHIICSYSISCDLSNMKQGIWSLLREDRIIYCFWQRTAMVGQTVGLSINVIYHLSTLGLESPETESCSGRTWSRDGEYRPWSFIGWPCNINFNSQISDNYLSIGLWAATCLVSDLMFSLRSINLVSKSRALFSI